MTEQRDKAEQIAEIILSMTYQELTLLCYELVDMQKTAPENGFHWEPGELHGEYALPVMLTSWAESK